MLAKAERCEELVNDASDRGVRFTLRELAQQWRDMALQLHLLERDPTYRTIRNQRDD